MILLFTPNYNKPFMIRSFSQITTPLDGYYSRMARISLLMEDSPIIQDLIFLKAAIWENKGHLREIIKVFFLMTGCLALKSILNNLFWILQQSLTHHLNSPTHHVITFEPTPVKQNINQADTNPETSTRDLKTWQQSTQQVNLTNTNLELPHPSPDESTAPEANQNSKQKRESTNSDQE